MFLKVESMCRDALGFAEFTSKVNHKLSSHGAWARTSGLAHPKHVFRGAIFQPQQTVFKKKAKSRPALREMEETALSQMSSFKGQGVWDLRMF